MNFREYINHARLLGKGYKEDNDQFIHEVNNLMLEKISREDLHNKYYSNIEPEIFNQILDSDPTKNNDGSPGKYSKWLLKLYLNNKLKIEDLYKATEYLTYFKKYFNHIEVSDINKISSLVELYHVIEKFKTAEEEGSTEFSSNSELERMAKENADKLYEDGKFLVIQPRSKEAAQYYGKGTEWCTSALNNCQFDNYNEDGPLYILINKKTQDKYQFHKESQQFMNANDKNIEKPIAETIGSTNGLDAFFKSKGIDLLDDGMLGYYYIDDNDGKGTRLFYQSKVVGEFDFTITEKHVYPEGNYSSEYDFFWVKDEYNEEHIIGLNIDEPYLSFSSKVHFKPNSVDWYYDNWLFYDGSTFFNLYDNSKYENIIDLHVDIDTEEGEFKALFYNDKGFVLLRYDGSEPEYYDIYPKGITGEDLYDVTFDPDERCAVLELDDHNIYITIDEDNPETRVVEK